MVEQHERERKHGASSQKLQGYFLELSVHFNPVNASSAGAVIEVSRTSYHSGMSTSSNGFALAGWLSK
jgi:hypothetical protein